MDQSEDITELATAIAIFQSKMPKLEKTANNPFFKSKYVELSTVMETALPLTSEEGLSIVQFPGVMGDDEVLFTQVQHRSGQWQRSYMKLHLTKHDAQGQGSALTYAKRYAAMAALGIVADDDDDGNAAAKAPAKQTTKKATTPPELTGTAVKYAKPWELMNIRNAAKKVSKIQDVDELDEWIEATLNVKMDKFPQAWVLNAIEKLDAMSGQTTSPDN